MSLREEDHDEFIAGAPQEYKLDTLPLEIDVIEGEEFGSTSNMASQDHVGLDNAQGRPGTSKSTKRHRPYIPRTGPARERNLQAQRRYRERLKEKAVATEAELATAAEELREARAIQDALRAENSALELLRGYTDGVLLALRSAAESLANSASSAASSAVSGLFAIHADIIDYLWSKALRPSDYQLRFLARHCDRLPTSFLCNAFTGRLVAAVEQWHRSPPAGREAVEKKLSRIFETRARVAAIVFTEFPENEAHFLRANTYGPEAHAVIDGAASLSAPDVLEAVVLTDHQVDTLNGHWETYATRYRSAKGLVAAAAAQVHMASESFQSEGNSLRGLARRNTDAQRGTSAASAFLAEERAARSELIAAAIRTLHPIQTAWMSLVAFRVLPGPDIVAALTHILPHMVRSPVPPPAVFVEKMQSFRTAEEAAAAGTGAGRTLKERLL